MSSDQIETSIVFKALSKPATVMGVDYDYFLVASLIVMIIFIFSGNILSLLSFLPLQLIGWILCKLDPHIFKLLSVRAAIGTVRNKNLWKCQSYEAF